MFSIYTCLDVICVNIMYIDMHRYTFLIDVARFALYVCHMFCTFLIHYWYIFAWGSGAAGAWGSGAAGEPEQE